MESIAANHGAAVLPHRGAAQRSSVGEVAGLYISALTRDLLPQVEALDIAEEDGAAQASRRSSKQSVADAVQKSLASLTETVFEECAAESDPSTLQQQQQDAQAAVS